MNRFRAAVIAAAAIALAAGYLGGSARADATVPASYPLRAGYCRNRAVPDGRSSAEMQRLRGSRGATEGRKFKAAARSYNVV